MPSWDVKLRGVEATRTRIQIHFIFLHLYRPETSLLPQWNWVPSTTELGYSQPLKCCLGKIGEAETPVWEWDCACSHHQDCHTCTLPNFTCAARMIAFGLHLRDPREQPSKGKSKGEDLAHVTLNGLFWITVISSLHFLTHFQRRRWYKQESKIWKAILKRNKGLMLKIFPFFSPKPLVSSVLGSIGGGGERMEGVRGISTNDFKFRVA